MKPIFLFLLVLIAGPLVAQDLNFLTTIGTNGAASQPKTGTQAITFARWAVSDPEPDGQQSAIGQIAG
jgi:hypothetical protein